MDNTTRQHKRMKELMGIETIELFEQTQVGVSKNPVTAKVTGVSVDSEVGTSSTNQGTEDFAQGYVDADGALGALRNAIGTTPISQGLVNEVVELN